ncbi:hypothetical protein GCM10027275_45760 [Rhabdobacter roseus]|uniref:Uncharacterized protein n=1 Tax=Rhabdobacter roseus TaxID=1655419 RepID=A0A840TQZ9_9BACT|nr:hypothetical protein [Rhabdobacter roseus]MBB5286756.1 hypothetical protein [Rhabdobacter roseus]
MLTYSRQSLRAVLILFLACLFSPSAFGQGKYLEGYLITHQKDTIRGFVKFDDWEKSPREVTFKETLAQAPQVLDISKVASFFVTSVNEKYVSKKIGLTHISDMRVYTSIPQVHTTDSTALYLQLLLDGPQAKLYKWGDEQGQKRFFVEKAGTLQELYNYQYQREVKGQIYMATLDAYKKQLQNLCSDAPAFKAAVPAYKEGALKAYLQKYNGFFSSELIAYQSDKPKTTFDVGFNAGLEQFIADARTQRASFGIAARWNLPRQHRNRFLKTTFNFTPNIPLEGTFKPGIALDIGFGSYFGSGNVRPFLSLHTGVSNHHSPAYFSGGLSWNRKLDVEVGHWGDFTSMFRKTHFFTPPRIGLHYYISTKRSR